MTLVLVRKLLRDVRLPLLVVWLVLFGFSALWVKSAQRVTSEIAPFFTAVGRLSNVDPKLFDEVLFKGPGRVSQSVLGGADVRFERPTDFLAVALLHPVVLVLATVWAVGRASGAVAGEIDRGTMELLLSQPVPRWHLPLAHFLVDLVVLPVLAAAVVAGTHAGLYLVGPFRIDYTVLDKLPKPAAAFLGANRGPDVLPVDVAGLPAAAAQLAALMFAVSGLTMAVSAAGRSRWRATGLAVLVVLGMFVANVVGQLWDAVAWVRPLTVFFFYQPQRVWLKGDWSADPAEPWGLSGPLPLPAVAVLLAVGLVGYAIATWVFDRRDLPAPL